MRHIDLIDFWRAMVVVMLQWQLSDTILIGSFFVDISWIKTVSTQDRRMDKFVMRWKFLPFLTIQFLPNFLAWPKVLFGWKIFLKKYVIQLIWSIFLNIVFESLWLDSYTVRNGRTVANNNFNEKWKICFPNGQINFRW